MSPYSYLIIGGGMAGYAAACGIREVDPKGTIGLIAAEVDPPYDRPPLSKGLWNDMKLEEIWADTEQLEVELLLGRKAMSLDLRDNVVTDHAGEVYRFNKLLLAPGGSPRRLPFGGDRIIYFRNVEDYRRLRKLAEKGRRIAVIGGGFIGSEIAAALSMNGKNVTIIFPEQTIGARVFPLELGHFLNDYYCRKGVEIMPQSTVSNVTDHEDELVVHVGDGRKITVDGIVAGIGIEPNVTLAQRAGLNVANGIVVDGFLRASDPDVYAAGDVAAFYNPALDRVIRLEHEDNAKTMGRMAGRNMAGDASIYNHLPFFYSDLFDLGYEAVGEIHSGFETVIDWQEPFKEGVVYYLEGQRVRGVLLWNVWDQIDAARALIASPKPIAAQDLKHRLAV